MRGDGLAQSEPARDDATQHLSGAALNGEFRRELGGEGELLGQRGVIGWIGIDERGGAYDRTMVKIQVSNAA